MMFTVQVSLVDDFAAVREKIFKKRYSMMNDIVEPDLVLKTFSDPIPVSTVSEPNSNWPSPMNNLRELYPDQIVGETELLSTMRKYLHIVVLVPGSTEPPQKRRRTEGNKGESEARS